MESVKCPADNKSRIIERIAVLAVIILVGILAIFFGSRKVEFHTDEVWNYGLANNIGSFYPDIEYGKTYSGMGFYEDFLEVGQNDRFNYLNVLRNQSNDVHPPFYYIILHTVCSVFYDSFSIWYAIGVNLFWMAGILILLYRLVIEITGNKLVSWGFILSYGTTVACMDTILFLRMYAQFAFFTVALAYLIKHYWNRELTRKFYILLAAILILGTLSHYYFLIIAFALYASFMINLISEKKTGEIKKTVITGIASAVIYLILWFPIIFHLFFGYRGQEAISKAFSLKDFLGGAKSLFGVMNDEVFAGSIYLFLVIGIIAVALRVIEKKKLWCYETALLLSGVFYIAIVGKIAPFKVSRYIMAVFFIYELAAYISVIYLVKKFVKLRYVEVCAIVLFIGINVFNFISLHGYVPMDHYSAAYDETVELVKDKDVVFFVSPDDIFGIFDAFGILPKAGSYVVMDTEDMVDYLKDHDGEYIFGVYYLKGKLDDSLDGMEQIYTNGCAKFYKAGLVSHRGRF